MGDQSGTVSDTSSSDLTDSSQWTYATTDAGQSGTTQKDNANLTAQANAAAQGLDNSNEHSALHGGTDGESVTTTATSTAATSTDGAAASAQTSTGAAQKAVTQTAATTAATTGAAQTATVAVPSTYSGSQYGIGVGGGGAGSGLTSSTAGLASWNQTWTASYNGNTISGNSAVTTSDGNVTSSNFQAVLNQVNITVNGVHFTNFVASPMTVNGVQYAGYLTASDGSGADFMIAVQATSGLSVYNLGSNFVYINQATPGTVSADSGATSTVNADAGTAGAQSTENAAAAPETVASADTGTTDTQTTQNTDATPETASSADSTTNTASTGTTQENSMVSTDNGLTADAGATSSQDTENAASTPETVSSTDDTTSTTNTDSTQAQSTVSADNGLTADAGATSSQDTENAASTPETVSSTDDTTSTESADSTQETGTVSADTGATDTQTTENIASTPTSSEAQTVENVATTTPSSTTQTSEDTPATSGAAAEESTAENNTVSTPSADTTASAETEETQTSGETAGTAASVAQSSDVTGTVADTIQSSEITETVVSTTQDSAAPETVTSTEQASGTSETTVSTGQSSAETATVTETTQSSAPSETPTDTAQASDPTATTASTAQNATATPRPETPSTDSASAGEGEAGETTTPSSVSTAENAGLTTTSAGSEENNISQSSDGENAVSADKSAQADQSATLSGSTLTLTSDQGPSSAKAQFNSGLDMSRPFKFGARLKGIGSAPFSEKNYLGITFTPSYLAHENIRHTDRQLAIEGLPNSIFAGWASNDDDNFLEVATTNDKGEIQQAGSTDVGINPMTKIPVSADRSGAMTAVWDPMMQFADGTVTGSFTLTINGKTVTHANLKVHNQAHFGIVGATDGRHPALAVDFAQSSFIAYKKAAPVTVRYIDQATGFSLAAPSTIDGELGQTISVSAVQDTTQPNLYTAPKIAGYRPSDNQTHSVTVGTDAMENEIHMAYEGLPRVQNTIYQLPGGKSFQVAHMSTTGVDFPAVYIPQVDGYVSQVDGQPATILPQENAARDQSHTVTYVEAPQHASFSFARDKMWSASTRCQPPLSKKARPTTASKCRSSACHRATSSPK